MLERISGSYEAGIYAMTYRLGDMLNMISYLFAVLLLPIFSRMLNRSENVEPVFTTAFKLLLTGCVWLTIVCTFHAEWILGKLYNSHISEASVVLPWTVASAGLFSLQYTTGTLLTAAGKMKAMIVISAFALCLNIALNFLLIPASAALGAAQAAFFTQLFVFCIQVISAQRLFQVCKTPLLMRSAAFISISVGLATLVATFDWNPLFSISIFSFCILTIGSLLKMIPIGDLIRNLRPENAS